MSAWIQPKSIPTSHHRVAVCDHIQPPVAQLVGQVDPAMDPRDWISAFTLVCCIVSICNKDKTCVLKRFARGGMCKQSCAWTTRCDLIYFTKELVARSIHTRSYNWRKIRTGLSVETSDACLLFVHPPDLQLQITHPQLPDYVKVKIWSTHPSLTFKYRKCTVQFHFLLLNNYVYLQVIHFFIEYLGLLNNSLISCWKNTNLTIA